MKIKIAGLLLAIVVPIIIFVSAIEIAVFDKAFYMEQMEKNQVIEKTGIYPPDVDLVVDQIMAYLKNERESFAIAARIAPPQAKNVSQKEIIFNEKEISHMVDVRNLFNNALGIRDFCLILFLISFLYLFKYDRKMIPKRIFWGNLSAVKVLALVIIAFVFNFQEAFVLFHRLFFTNDLWILDPAKDVLINIVPEAFFVALISRIIAYLTAFLGLTTIGAGIYLYGKGGKHENLKH